MSRLTYWNFTILLAQTAHPDPGQIYSAIVNEIEQLDDREVYGRISAVQGMLVEVAGVPQSLIVGGRCAVSARSGRDVLCEVIGFRDGKACLTSALMGQIEEFA